MTHTRRKIRASVAIERASCWLLLAETRRPPPPAFNPMDQKKSIKKQKIVSIDRVFMAWFFLQRVLILRPILMMPLL